MFFTRNLINNGLLCYSDLQYSYGFLKIISICIYIYVCVCIYKYIYINMGYVEQINALVNSDVNDVINKTTVGTPFVGLNNFYNRLT